MPLNLRCTFIKYIVRTEIPSGLLLPFLLHSFKHTSFFFNNSGSWWDSMFYNYPKLIAKICVHMFFPGWEESL